MYLQKAPNRLLLSYSSCRGWVNRLCTADCQPALDGFSLANTRHVSCAAGTFAAERNRTTPLMALRFQNSYLCSVSRRSDDLPFRRDNASMRIVVLALLQVSVILQVSTTAEAQSQRSSPTSAPASTPDSSGPKTSSGKTLKPSSEPGLPRSATPIAAGTSGGSGDPGSPRTPRSLDAPPSRAPGSPGSPGYTPTTGGAGGHGDSGTDGSGNGGTSGGR
jgi:hypothetical protein